jgi:hypothetical protein
MLRRLFTSDGVIIGGESRSRGFRGSLAKVMDARDGGRCTAPYCDAPIRHRDHRFRHSEGGPTSFENGRGLCVFHNHVREIGITRRPPRKSGAGAPSPPPLFGPADSALLRRRRTRS